MNTVEPRPGPGRFQWNAGGWFGALLGSTVYLPVGALAFGDGSGLLASIWWMCWAATVGTGVWLWTRRDRIAPYPALQALLGVMGTANLVAVLALLQMNREALHQVNLSPPGAIACLLVVPALMLQFALMEGRARRAAGRREA